MKEIRNKLKKRQKILICIIAFLILCIVIGEPYEKLELTETEQIYLKKTLDSSENGNRREAKCINNCKGGLVKITITKENNKEMYSGFAGKYQTATFYKAIDETEEEIYPPVRTYVYYKSKNIAVCTKERGINTKETCITK